MAAGATLAAMLAGRPRSRRLVRAAEVPDSEGQREQHDPYHVPGSNTRQGQSKRQNPSGTELKTRDSSEQLQYFVPTPEEIVNTDVPNRWLSVSRPKPMNNVLGRRHKGRTGGRSKASRKKVAWRLAEGPALRHNNWEFPSRLRIRTGIAKLRRLEQPVHTIRPTMDKIRAAVGSSLTSLGYYNDRRVSFLDLFAGTGSMGIDALSRGASECIFVDSSEECVDCCLANAWLAGFMSKEDAAKGPINERKADKYDPVMMVGGPRSKIQMELHKAQVARTPVGAIKADVLDLLEDPAKYGLVNRSFGCIFVSPPWEEISFRKLCTALAKTELLERDGFVVIEYPRELGALPPVLNAPFDDPDDYDFDLEAGIPTLHGVRNRVYANTVVAMYVRMPTGARGAVGGPRPWEFARQLIGRNNRREAENLWMTPSLFVPNGRGQKPAFSVPDKKPQLDENATNEK